MFFVGIERSRRPSTEHHFVGSKITTVYRESAAGQVLQILASGPQLVVLIREEIVVIIGPHVDVSLNSHIFAVVGWRYAFLFVHEVVEKKT